MKPHRPRPEPEAVRRRVSLSRGSRSFFEYAGRVGQEQGAQNSAKEIQQQEQARPAGKLWWQDAGIEDQKQQEAAVPSGSREVEKVAFGGSRWLPADNLRIRPQHPPPRCVRNRARGALLATICTICIGEGATGTAAPSLGTISSF